MPSAITASLAVETRRAGLEARERLADPADLAARPGRGDAAKGGACDDQCSGKDIGQPVAAWSRQRGGNLLRQRKLADRYRFAGQQRLIELQPRILDYPAVRGHPVAFGENDNIVANYLAAGNAEARAIAHHQRTRAGEVTQCLKRALAARFLDHGDRDREAGQHDQDHGFLQVAKKQIYHAAANQQRQHRLTQDLERDPENCPVPLSRQLVGAFAVEPCARHAAAQAFGACERNLDRGRIAASLRVQDVH
jgi:hypothetical protein